MDGNRFDFRQFFTKVVCSIGFLRCPTWAQPQHANDNQKQCSYLLSESNGRVIFAPHNIETIYDSWKTQPADSLRAEALKTHDEEGKRDIYAQLNWLNEDEF